MIYAFDDEKLGIYSYSGTNIIDYKIKSVSEPYKVKERLVAKRYSSYDDDFQKSKERTDISAINKSNMYGIEYVEVENTNDYYILESSKEILDEYIVTLDVQYSRYIFRRVIMAIIKGLEWTFDTVAPYYEKLRPGYADELYETLFEYAPINDTSSVVEVGIGGGQATLPVLRTECRLTAVEYGENFSGLCREKFREYPNFSVITGKFEDVDFKESEYDLVYSASAFHWVPEEIGYPKVFSMLKSGGVFARFANHPYCDKSNSALSEEIDNLYDMYYYKFHNKKRETPKEYSEEQARQRAMIAERYGFDDIRYYLFYRTRTFSAREYAMLLGTYSDHIAIEETIRTEFFSKIEGAINRHGGKITVYDTMDLQLARK